MPTPTKGPRLGGSPAHERLLLANEATARANLGPQDVMHGAIRRRLADLYEAMGRPDEARAWRDGTASRPSAHSK